MTDKQLLKDHAHCRFAMQAALLRAAHHHRVALNFAEGFDFAPAMPDIPSLSEITERYLALMASVVDDTPRDALGADAFLDLVIAILTGQIAYEYDDMGGAGGLVSAEIDTTFALGLLQSVKRWLHPQMAAALVAEERKGWGAA